MLKDLKNLFIWDGNILPFLNFYSNPLVVSFIS